jgi:glycerol-3-phosphate acyltransferase PlsY
MSVASILAAVAVPAAGWWLYGSSGRILPGALTVLGLLIIWRHKGNIQRLITGTENRFEFKKQTPESSGRKSEE